MSEPFDLVVRGGTVVTAGGRGEADVGVRDGRIVQLGGTMHGERELDARGCYVLPGGLDLHVHFAAQAPQPGGPPQFVDDFASGSRAAVAGGITTFGNMSFPDEEHPTIRGAIARDEAAAAQQSVTDYLLHPGVFTATPDLPDAVPQLAAAGHLSFKIVTLGFDVDPANLVRSVALAGENGMLTLVHCEDHALIDFVTDELVRHGHGLERYADSRPDFTESAAVERAVALCEATGAPVCIVHLSSEAALDVTRRARARGLPVFVETRPFYLNLTRDAYDGDEPGRFLGMPPLREHRDREVLWRGLADGSIDTVASDHAPFFLADKIDPDVDLHTCRKGVAEIEAMLPMLWSDGVAQGRLTPERLVAVVSTNAARLNGVYPRKGTIAVGSDADLVVLDPQRSRVIDAATMQSRADYCVYDGLTVTGWPRFTVSRGDVVVDDGEITAAEGRGRLVPRLPTARP
ncbi:amidohydrolase family protein [Jatrophihabitans fulvus]